MNSPFAFKLPDELVAKEPPEERGIARDQVRLMITRKDTGNVIHTRFDHIGEHLRPGDLLVFNASRTLPAQLEGVLPDGTPIELRLAERLPDDSWLALLLCRQGELFACGLHPATQVELGQGLQAEIISRDTRIPRLWKVRFSLTGSELMAAFYRLGKPIRYEYVAAPWQLEYYQNVYAREPGSAEMPSAGRAFTWKALFHLRDTGIQTAHISLHTGLSSYMDDDLDSLHLASEEEFSVSQAAAMKINTARANGARIIAIGTTVVRALESAADLEGFVSNRHGYTTLRITPASKLKVVDGLLTGFHEPEASHLDMLAAFMPPDRIKLAYNEAIRAGYLWHEFGDLNLIL
jgi:S-adenosylmethionine:tRNA ribosyltransferase-isomerase